jgi:hypothetical protein
MDWLHGDGAATPPLWYDRPAWRVHHPALLRAWPRREGGWDFHNLVFALVFDEIVNKIGQNRTESILSRFSFADLIYLPTTGNIGAAFLGQFLHFLMLAGLLVALWWPQVGSPVAVMAAALFLVRTGSNYPAFLMATTLPVLVLTASWWALRRIKPATSVDS